MQNRVARVTPQPRYRLQVEFDDGVTGIIDLSKKARYAPWRSCAFTSARKVALMRVW